MAPFGGCETSNPRKGRASHLISFSPSSLFAVASQSHAGSTEGIWGAKVRANRTSPSLALVEPPWLSQRGWATCKKSE